ncbi:MAG: carboxypeptidase regulatory-like domain-containing protein [Ignavibacteriae bacterium]|nr:carboxypeptidase regulatory-like domain-containing protein [Ignavibacteriota bacterium]
MRIATQRFLPLVIGSFALVLLLSSCKDEPGTAPALGDTITGIAKDEQGYGVPNAIVTAVTSANALVAVDTSDDFGIFTLSTLPTDKSGLIVRVSHGDFKSYVAPLQSVSGGGGAVLLMTHVDSACGSLKLTIRDITTLAALSGAEVRLKRNGVLVSTTTTDATGYLEFNYLIAGSYSLRIAKTGYRVVERNATIQFCDSTSMDIRMEATTTGGEDSCCRGVLTVIARSAANNAILIGASIKVQKQGGDARYKSSTDSGAVFYEMCPGTYWVRIAKDGYQVQEFDVVMGCSEIKQVDRSLTAAAGDSCCHSVLTIIPMSQANNSVLVGASVKLSKGGTTYGPQTTTQAGTSFDGLCPGTYAVRIQKEGFLVKEYEIAVGCNETKTDDPRLQSSGSNDSCCQGSINFTIIDSTTRAALNGATVKLWKGSSLVATQSTGGDNRGAGQVLFTNRCEGEYQISIIKTGYKSREFGFRIGCNEQYSHTLGLLQQSVDSCDNATLKVRVKDSTTNTWLNDALVEIGTSSAWLYSGYTASEGTYIKQGLRAPMTYVVRVSKNGYTTKQYEVRFVECNTIIKEVFLAP